MRMLRLFVVACIVAVGMSGGLVAGELSPYGNSKADLHPYPARALSSSRGCFSVVAVPSENT